MAKISMGSIPKKKQFFFVYSYKGKKMDHSYGGDEGPRPLWQKCCKKGYNF